MKWEKRHNGYELRDDAGVAYGVVFKAAHGRVLAWCWEQRVPGMYTTVRIGATRYVADAKALLIARVVEARLEA